MRLESCRHFDTEKFIKQLRIWREEKKKLQAQLDAIPLLPSSGDDIRVKSSDISDPTTRIVMKRLEIVEQIKDIEMCERVYDIAKASLTQEELEIFQMFFEPKKLISTAIDEYSGGNYVCRGIVYKRRRQVLDKLDRIIGGYFEE